MTPRTALPGAGAAWSDRRAGAPAAARPALDPPDRHAVAPGSDCGARHRPAPPVTTGSGSGRWSSGPAAGGTAACVGAVDDRARPAVHAGAGAAPSAPPGRPAPPVRVTAVAPTRVPVLVRPDVTESTRRRHRGDAHRHPPLRAGQRATVMLGRLGPAERPVIPLAVTLRPPVAPAEPRRCARSSWTRRVADRDLAGPGAGRRRESLPELDGDDLRRAVADAAMTAAGPRSRRDRGANRDARARRAGRAAGAAARRGRAGTGGGRGRADAVRARAGGPSTLDELADGFGLTGVRAVGAAARGGAGAGGGGRRTSSPPAVARRGSRFGAALGRAARRALERADPAGARCAAGTLVRLLDPLARPAARWSSTSGCCTTWPVPGTSTRGWRRWPGLPDRRPVAAPLGSAAADAVARRGESGRGASCTARNAATSQAVVAAAADRRTAAGAGRRPSELPGEARERERMPAADGARDGARRRARGRSTSPTRLRAEAAGLARAVRGLDAPVARRWPRRRTASSGRTRSRSRSRGSVWPRGGTGRSRPCAGTAARCRTARWPGPPGCSTCAVDDIDGRGPRRRRRGLRCGRPAGTGPGTGLGALATVIEPARRLGRAGAADPQTGAAARRWSPRCGTAPLVLHEWGFADRSARGLGTTALFAGPERHRQDAGRRGDRRRARASTWCTSTSARW